MIDPQGWLDWATRRPGPPNKIYAQRNAMKGMALHSMEGWYAGSMEELDKPERQASWTFSVRLSGELVQHYPVMASSWASGNAKANTELVSVETEGVTPTEANAAQVATLVRLVREVGVYAGWKPSRAEPKTLWEHREVWNWVEPNAGATACPSERYAPLYAALAAEQPAAASTSPTDDILLALFAGKEQLGTRPTMAERLAYAKWRVAEIVAGRAPSLGELAAMSNTDLPEHWHEPGGVQR